MPQEPSTETDAQPPPPSPAPAAPKRTVQRVAWWLYPVLAPLVWLLALWLRTLRLRWSEDALKVWRALGGGRVVVFWHNRLIFAPEIRRRMAREVPINALISASKDGSWLTVFFNLLDVGAIRGSSSWRGSTALLEVVRKLRDGEDVGITPDGPRGPCYQLKHSIAQIAAHTNRPVVLVGMRIHRGWRLSSWDGFYLPAPFSRVDVLLDFVPEDDPDRQLPEDAFSARLRERLLALTDDSGFVWKPKRLIGGKREK